MVVTWLDNEHDEEAEGKVGSRKRKSGLMIDALVDSVKLDIVFEIVNRTWREI